MLKASSEELPPSFAPVTNSSPASNSIHPQDSSSSSSPMAEHLVVGTTATCALSLLCVLGCLKYSQRQTVARGGQVRVHHRPHVKAATTIQRHWRRWKNASYCRRRQRAMVFLIAAGHGALECVDARRRVRAATCIQARWRGWVKVVRYRRRQHAAVFLRAIGRGALVLQNAYRCTVAVTCIQAVWRGYTGASRYRRRQHAMNYLHALGRSALVRLDASHYHRRHCAVKFLHASGCSALIHLDASRRMVGFIRIQRRWRSWRKTASCRQHQLGGGSVQDVGSASLVRIKHPATRCCIGYTPTTRCRPLNPQVTAAYSVRRC